jgi:hypothetical protein
MARYLRDDMLALDIIVHVFTRLSFVHFLKPMLMLGHHFSAEQWLKDRHWWSENSTDPSTYIASTMVRQGRSNELHRLGKDPENLFYLSQECSL